MAQNVLWEPEFGVGYQIPGSGKKQIINNQGNLNPELLNSFFTIQKLELNESDLSDTGKSYLGLLRKQNPGFYLAPKVENRDDDCIYLGLIGHEPIKLGNV